ncbi:RNA-directed DNA polymerase [Chitinophaga japonensis]|uniref:Reverse transcriptase (RNA-dependent DNA polymerase) n=1 Tax=Chitinophaga japonensis TaxID=104662 RepID=A0A562TC67_CHIJA|nr:RNA-directed DNA polymerase [Chitinophaga japonensis]TWI91147.1 reverse transcriptase (RNA-dependent DNA polymerase) [Chitinophaga japonensis]
MIKLAESSYRWAIKHLLKENDTDLFPRPFEITIIQEMEDELIKELADLDLTNYQWNAARRFLIPKDNLSYRNATQLHPIDSIVLAAILYEYGNLIENNRLPDNIVFSYRFKPLSDGTMYANKTAWNNFWEACRDKISTLDEEEGKYELDSCYEYVVTCDISDFYNQIYLHTIENQLRDCGFPNQVQKRIAELIKVLNLSTSRGIPIGPHSSHILAEMSLIPVDNNLSLRGIPFLRYVDDMVFFCKNEKEARIRILQIADILDKEQRLALQRQKTREFKVREFFKYTRKMLGDEPVYEAENEIVEIIRKYTGGNAYTKIVLSAIDNKDLRRISKGKVVDLLQEYLDAENFEKLRWLYRRLSQIGIPHAVEFSIENFQNLIPALNDICLYINSCAENFQSDWKNIGGKILELLDDEIVNNNPFYQISLLNLFVYNNRLNHIGILIDKFKSANEDVKRKILLSSINYKNAAWINQLKEDQVRFSEWTRRAYIIATKSLPPEQKKFLHGNIRETLNQNQILERLLLQWAK